MHTTTEEDRIESRIRDEVKKEYLKSKEEEKDFICYLDRWKFENKWNYVPSEDGKNYLHETGLKTNINGIIALYYGRVDIKDHPITNANSSSEGL